MKKGSRNSTQRIDNVDTVIVAVGVRPEMSILNCVENLTCKVLKVGDANGVKADTWESRMDLKRDLMHK